MATKPISNALVRVNIGSDKEMSAYTTSAGEARVTFDLSESEYNAIALVSATATKLGYVDGRANVTSLPSFAEARASGINMQMMMQVAASQSEFAITPSVLVFDSTGGYQTATVTCPDDSWTIYSSDSDISLQRLEGSQISVRCNSGSAARTFDPIVIRWRDPVNGWQYRECAVSRLAAGSVEGYVTFSGRAIDTSTGSGLASAAVKLSAYIGGSSPSTTLVGTTTTDSSGNWSITVLYADNTWPGPKEANLPVSSLGSFSVEISKSGYLSNSISVPYDDMPVFATAVSSGVSWSNINVSPESINSGVVNFYAAALSGNQYLSGASILISIFTAGSAYPTYHYGTSDSSGRFVLPISTTRAEWDAITSISVIISKEGYVPYSAGGILPGSFDSALISGINFGNVRIDPALSISPTSITIGANDYGNAARRLITVTAGSASWVPSTNVSWLVGNRGSDTGFYVWATSKNTGSSARTGTVTFTWGSQTAILTVTQTAE